VADNIVRICAKTEIAPESVKAYDVGDKRLAVFNIGGRYYVTDDECTHASASLADGMLDGEVIECAVHMGAFHVPTGEGQGAALRGGAAHLQGRAGRRRRAGRSRPRRGRRISLNWAGFGRRQDK